jgi:menaquinone-dependent protoporphyrinogen oxidase
LRHYGRLSAFESLAHALLLDGHGSNHMKPLLVLYATREGHTRRIAEHVVATAAKHGVQALSRDLTATAGDIAFGSFSGIVMAGPIHAGKHSRELLRFVKHRREALSQVPTLLLTVCLAQAGVEAGNTDPAKRTSAEHAVQALIDDFSAQTGFHPTRAKAIAGALPYTQYNFFIRWVMRRIVAAEGGDTDTSRDYVYTDWSSLGRLIEEFLRSCGPLPDEAPARLAS